MNPFKPMKMTCRKWQWWLVVLMTALAGTAVRADNQYIPPPAPQTNPPSITSQPVSQTVCLGSSASFTVTASGDGTLSYQWNKNSVAIPGATSTTLTINPVATTDAGTYYVVVTSTYGSAPSAHVTLTVIPSQPTINSQPSPQTVVIGQTASFAVGASGSALTYQWRKNGVNLSDGLTGNGSAYVGTQTPVLRISLVSVADAVSDSQGFDCVVSNPCGSPAPSSRVGLTVNTTASVDCPPGLVGWWRGENNGNDSSGYNNNGTLESVDFTNGVVGRAFAYDPEIHMYVWIVVSIPDAPVLQLTNSLTIEGWVRPRTSSFWVWGAGWTIFAREDENHVPYYLSMEGNNVICFGIGDGSNNFATISTPLDYNQWWHVAATFDSGAMKLYVNGSLVSQTNTTIRPLGPLNADATLGIGNSGAACCDNDNFSPYYGDIDEISLYNRALSSSEVTGIYNAGSAGKHLTITIVEQPVSQAVALGQNASLTVGVGGSMSLSYQWFFNNQPLSDGGGISGSQTATLTLSNVQMSQLGGYYAVVSYSGGSTTSSTAMLTLASGPGQDLGFKVRITEPKNNSIIP